MVEETALRKMLGEGQKGFARLEVDGSLGHDRLPKAAEVGGLALVRNRCPDVADTGVPEAACILVGARTIFTVTFHFLVIGLPARAAQPVVGETIRAKGNHDKEMRCRQPS